MANEVEATITITNSEGVEVPIGFQITWPEDMGIYALHALKKFDQIQNLFGNSILQQLTSNGDASLLAHLPDEEDE